MKIDESLIVGVNFTNGKDRSVLIVGRQKNGKMHIINAFTDDEAEELYKKLITKRKGEKK